MYIVNIHRKGDTKTLLTGKCEAGEEHKWLKKGNELKQEHACDIVVSFRPAEKSFTLEYNPKLINSIVPDFIDPTTTDEGCELTTGVSTLAKS